jgi:hypothetical protein
MYSLGLFWGFKCASYHLMSVAKYTQIGTVFDGNIAYLESILFPRIYSVI